MIGRLEQALPQTVDENFGLPPKLTVTAINGGVPGAYSVVPDRRELEIDVRLTQGFTATGAHQLVAAAVSDIDNASPASRPGRMHQTVESWPPFRLPAEHALGLVATTLTGGSLLELEGRDLGVVNPEGWLGEIEESTSP